MDQAPGYVGVAVAQAESVVALAPAGGRRAVPPTAADVGARGARAARLRAHAPALVVLEAAGGREAPLAAALGDARRRSATLGDARRRSATRACRSRS